MSSFQKKKVTKHREKNPRRVAHSKENIKSTDTAAKKKDVVADILAKDFKTTILKIPKEDMEKVNKSMY